MRLGTTPDDARRAVELAAPGGASPGYFCDGNMRHLERRALWWIVTGKPGHLYQAALCQRCTDQVGATIPLLARRAVPDGRFTIEELAAIDAKLANPRLFS